MSEIVNSILAGLDVKPKSVFVSFYNVERCYGGPEEGGWWYDHYSFEGSKAFATQEAADMFFEAAKTRIEEANNRGKKDRYRAMASLPDEEAAGYPEGYIPRHWSDGGTLSIVIETIPGELATLERPHYE